MYNSWCSEMGYGKKNGDLREFYAKKVVENFHRNLMVTQSGQNSYSLSQELQDVYDEAVEYVDDYATQANLSSDFDDDAWVEAVVESISEELKHPFENVSDYIWQPITYALDSLGLQDGNDLSKIEGATNGQHILIAYYVLGTREELPWGWLMRCVG